MCVSGAVITKAGENVSTTLNTEYEDYFIPQAEALINLNSRYDWIANYAAVETNVKAILEQLCSDLAAIYAIQYDMSGYTSRGEAESMITVLRDRALHSLQLLKDQKGVTFTK